MDWNATDIVMECRDPAFYAATGAEGWEEAREEALWRHAQGKGAAGIRAHLADCRACASLATRLSRLAKTLARKEPVTFALCPSAETLSAFHYGTLAADARAAVDRHLAACGSCRNDSRWLMETAAPGVVAMPRRNTWMHAAAAAAALVLLALPLARVGSEPAPGTSPFADLARTPAPEAADLESTLGHPEFSKPRLEAALAASAAKDLVTLEGKALEILADHPQDATGVFLLALHAHNRGNHGAANRYAGQSESMAPMTHFRCWYALQMALLDGDESRVRHECGHLDGDPRFSNRTRAILAAVRRRSKART
jgi:hypothetical protein